jgi:hypothetical protein
LQRHRYTPFVAHILADFMQILNGMQRELVSGTLAARQTVVQMLLYLHGCYASEAEFLVDIRSIVLE